MKAWTALVSMIALAAIVCGTSACASEEAGEVKSKTSPAQKVEAAEDNAAVLSRSVSGLIVTLELDGTRVVSHEARVASVPRDASGPKEGDVVRIRALSGGATIASTTVADQRIYATEGEGLLEIDQRTLFAMLPLTQSADTLEIDVPGAAEPQRIDVGGVLKKFCAESPKTALCSR